MAKNVRLKNSDGVVIYPQTKVENIIDKDNLVSADTLQEVIEGDEFITVDVNEVGTKLKVSLDTDYQPHVVELSGTSGTLTNEQYLQLCGETSSYTAQILLNGNFYHSTSELTAYDTYTNINTRGQEEEETIEINIIVISKQTATKGQWNVYQVYSNATQYQYTDEIASATLVGGEPLDFAYYKNDDAHWHFGSTVKADADVEVSDNLIVSGIENITNGTSPLFWHGTLAQYNALSTKNSDTLYIITES